MIEVLAVIGGTTTLAAIVAIIYLAFKLVEAQNAVGAVRDLLDSQRRATEDTERDRDGFKAQLDAERQRTKDLTDRLAVAESERNAAYQQARDHVVEQIKASNIADAARLVNDLLSRPLLGVVPPRVPDATAQATADGAGQAGAMPSTKPSGPAR